MKQLARYAAVGVVSNAIGYFAYLLLTAIQITPKIAMTLVYLTGASVGFIGNCRWTFSHRGSTLPAVLKYGLAHFCGYTINFFILYIFVDKMQYTHQVVQAFAIIVVAVILYIVQKKLVFSRIKRNPYGVG